MQSEMLSQLPTTTGVQIAVCIGLTLLVGLATWLTIRPVSYTHLTLPTILLV